MKPIVIRFEFTDDEWKKILEYWTEPELRHELCAAGKEVIMQSIDAAEND